MAAGLVEPICVCCMLAVFDCVDGRRGSCSRLYVFVEVFAGQGAVLLARVIEPQSFVNGLGHFVGLAFVFPSQACKIHDKHHHNRGRKHRK